MPFSWSSSTELQKPFAGQPTVNEVLEVVLKECRKESLVYKVAALRCAADVLHSSQEDRFSTMAEILFPLIKKVCARPSIFNIILIAFAQTVFNKSSQITNRAAQKVAAAHQGHSRRMRMTETQKRKRCRRKLSSARLRLLGSPGPETQRLRVNQGVSSPTQTPDRIVQREMALFLLSFSSLFAHPYSRLDFIILFL